jgi:alkylation response protein AidB-like acyl-CoA dehydrogenase
MKDPGMVDYTAEQLLLRDTVREYSQAEIVPRVMQRDAAGEFPLEEIEAAAAAGLLGIAVPEELGGFQLDAVTTAMVYEEVSRFSAAVSVILSVHNSLVCAGINRFASIGVQEAYLPTLASGELLGAYCLTEAEAGSDAGSLTTRAVRDGDIYRITGRKLFVTSGAHAGVYIVFAVTDPEARKSRRISAFVVNRSSPGLNVSPGEKKLGLLASEINEVVFDDCQVPAENMLGEPGDGFGIALTLLDSGRIGIASQAVGIGQAALDASLEYATTRQQFGQEISNFQAIQWKLADMSTELDAARLLVRRAASLKDAGEPFGTEAAKAKLYASEMANRAASTAIQIHGGYGYIRDYGVERLFRDAKATELYEGTSEIQRLVIARSLLREFRT